MAIILNQFVKLKWHNSNKKRLMSQGYRFTKMGNEIEVHIKHIINTKEIAKFQCDYCNKTYENNYQIATRYNNQFCSNDCFHKYRSMIADLKKPYKICEICGSKYKIDGYNHESRYCSNKCRHIGHSNVLKGREIVERVVLNCDWCGEEIKKLPKRVNEYNFCNMKCMGKWKKEVYSKFEEVAARNRKILLSNLTEGKISFLNSKPQVILNDLLIQKGYMYTNEKLFGTYSADSYLNDFDLIIEVNGTYWHCDNRYYDQINYQVQLNKILMDKKKRSYIKNQFNKNILYLWEFDIETNIKLCELLLEKYIQNKGILDNYHSFNYHIEHGQLEMNDKIIIPFMDWDIEDLYEIVKLDVKKTRRKPENHVIFNCEQCGKEKSRKKSDYNKKKHHFCSVECSVEYRKNKSKTEVV